jgi:HEAT repeat protein
MTLAALQDEDALPALLDLSASPDVALSGAAFVALERTTGLSLPRRTDRWRSWFAVEQEWAADGSARVLAGLKSESVPRILASLREISAHRLGRQRLSLLAAGLLVHPEPSVRLEACRTLLALGSPVSREALEQALSDAAPEVAAAAAAALRALREET